MELSSGSLCPVVDGGPQTGKNSPSRPEDSEIWSQVELIATSSGFRQSSRMVRFLRYIVRAALAGEEGELKETCIGVAVYDRGADYDPKIDPVVRNEARRLRQKLEKYYQDEGQLAPVLVSIRKGGYVPIFERRVVKVAEPDRLPDSTPNQLLIPGPPPTIEDAATSKYGRYSRFISICVTVLFVILAATLLYIAIWLRASHRNLNAALYATSVTPFTTSNREALQPALSPDGRTLAFVSRDPTDDFHLYVQQIGGTPLRLTDGKELDLRPTWSPDGSKLAYLSARNGRIDVYSIDVPGGAQRKLFTLQSSLLSNLTPEMIEILGSTGPEWIRDGKALVVSDEGKSSRSLALCEHDLSSGSEIVLTQPEGEEHDLWPRLSPDGKELLFVRTSSNSAADLYMVSLSNGSTERLTSEHFDVQGAAWFRGNDQIVFSSNRTGYYSLWILDRKSGTIRPLPAAGENDIDPSTTKSGARLVYVDSSANLDTKLVNLRPNGHDPAEVTDFAPAEGRTNNAQFSPDGTQVAFTSDRSGSWEVWVADANGANPRQLTHFGGPMVGTIHWSPDGQYIAFDARPDGTSGIFLVSSSGQPNLRRLSPHNVEERQPSWSHDGKWIYFYSRRQGTGGLWRESPGGTNLQLLCRMDVTDPQEAPDGKAVFFTAVGPGFWELPIGRGDPRRVYGLDGVSPHRLWEVVDNGIVFIDPITERDAVQIYDFSTKSVRNLVRLDQILVAADTPSLSLSPDHTRLLVAKQEQIRSRIMLLNADR